MLRLSWNFSICETWFSTTSSAYCRSLSCNGHKSVPPSESFPLANQGVECCEGRRKSRLDEGKLFLWIAEGVLPTAWERRTGTDFRVELPDPQIRAAVDGEPAVFDAALEFASLPGGLRVLVPERTTKPSP